eukprot:7009608-Pyramimonas_sp.AAC.2
MERIVPSTGSFGLNSSNAVCCKPRVRRPIRKRGTRTAHASGPELGGRKTLRDYVGFSAGYPIPTRTPNKCLRTPPVRTPVEPNISPQ